MPSSVLRRSAGMVRPQRYPMLRTPWLAQPTEVDWTAAAGISLTPGAANVKSAYVDLFASLAADCDAICVRVSAFSASGVGTGNTLMDIATGAAASEVDVIPNFAAGYTGSRIYMFPIAIAAGTRVSMRAQQTNAAPAAGLVQAYALKLPFGRSPSALVNIGAVTATSLGVSLGTTDNTWVEMIAATAQAYQGVVVTFGGDSDSAITATWDTLSFGVGAAGSEVEKSRTMVLGNTSENWTSVAAQNMLVPGHIGKGARLAAKGSNVDTNKIDVVLMAVPYS